MATVVRRERTCNARGNANRQRSGTDGANRLGACIKQFSFSRCTAVLDSGSLQDAVWRGQGTGPGGSATTCRPGEEISVRRPHCLSRGRQEAEDAETPSEDRVQPDAG